MFRDQLQINYLGIRIRPLKHSLKSYPQWQLKTKNQYSSYSINLESMPLLLTTCFCFAFRPTSLANSRLPVKIKPRAGLADLFFRNSPKARYKFLSWSVVSRRMPWGGLVIMKLGGMDGVYSRKSLCWISI